MKAFGRIFRYIWPQWHRLAVVGVCVCLIAILFSFSIVTVLPLLKVMMSGEGLRGWVDRMISADRYGVSFYVPNTVDLSQPETSCKLRITRVKKKSSAAKAGFQKDDLVVGAEGTERMTSVKLLEKLATAEDDAEIVVQYRRESPSGGGELKQSRLSAGEKPFYADFVQKSLRFIPREQSRESSRKAVIYIILVITVVTGMRCAARFLQDYMVSKVMHTSVTHLREDTFFHAMHIPVGFFASQGSSDTVSRLVRDTDQIGNGIKILFGKTLREPLKAVAMLAAAMVIDYRFTLIFLCGAPPSVYALSKLGRKIKRATRKTLASWAKVLGKLEEAISSVRIVKVYNRQEYEQKNFTSISRKLLKQQFRVAKVDTAASPLMEMLGMTAGCVGLIFGVSWVYQGAMESEEFFTLLILLGATAESVRKTGDVWNKIQKANAAAERVYSVIDQQCEFEKPGAFELTGFKDQIEFRDIIFTYPGAEALVLKGIDLTVQAGYNVAIVGPNGSGKTTLANLVPRFYDPEEGQILIDGIDIRDVSLRSLRSQIGMVTQDVATFNDTVAANIGYGKEGASKEEIVAASKRAFAHEFISLLPEGYDTIIGEHGAGLSGGQLQRIVIARAILKNPSILIFDEATSQVDADSEAKIHKAIEEIMRDRTSFIIAHRFSTVITADMIVVMDEGKIIAQGQHEELIQTCLLYQSLYETQLLVPE